MGKVHGHGEHNRCIVRFVPYQWRPMNLEIIG